LTTKAFDRIDHTLLLHKLIYFGIPNFSVKWIHFFLNHRKQRIKLNQDLSEWMTLLMVACGGTDLNEVYDVSFLVVLFFQIAINSLTG